MNRRTAREKALQALFQIEMSEHDTKTALDNVLEGEKEDQFLTKLVEGVMNNRDEIDTLIKNHLEKWSLARIANVDRNVLRLAVYELKFCEDIPNNVVLNEAIEISKLFSDEESSRFVNGVLSKIKEGLESDN